ncbi:methyltransferase domain-containing protein [Roseofilum sp. BLCC_M154]|uniref:Methyltransferase domain-containing protein n=1 Tax=Roseofilum acuticapitatum BLCC-M154 TaxID=3022444 RepID=A0ABT7AVX8_9CYAN|nr:class I SAM-dependent methyltransferase [Roseofilum acuticapitatum]MDJ1171076.1 methyltransferase domain-containing protein [Roseofilum acuticapitatum BLCC-M154]
MSDFHPVFWQLHSDLPRQGPGNFEATKQAFSRLSALPDCPQILDVGCGPGQQTLDLATLSQGKITAVDFYQPYLDELKQRFESRGWGERLEVVCADMADLPFAEQSFDLIWSEGAIYIMGFDRGLSKWRSLLKPGGYLAVTEISWLKPNPPEPVKEFWQEGYPSMRTLEENQSAMEGAGYTLVDTFTLPESAWWTDYYTPLENKIQQLKVEYQNDPEALQILEGEQQEIDLYRQYSPYFGYVFYIGQLADH